MSRPGPLSPRRRVSSWPLPVMALPAFVAIWAGWVGLGELTGFGVVHPLPGIWDELSINTAITLPIGVEAYAAYALRAWLTGSLTGVARRFAAWSSIGSLVLGASGQVAYHLLTASGVTRAPWWITTLVSCLPVAVFGMGATLAHLLSREPESVGQADLEVFDPAGEPVQVQDHPGPADREPVQVQDHPGPADREPVQVRLRSVTYIGPDLAERVAQAQALHPTATNPELAKIAGVGLSTVKRYKTKTKTKTNEEEIGNVSENE